MAASGERRDELRRVRRLAALARSASVAARERSQKAASVDRFGELQPLIAGSLAGREGSKMDSTLPGTPEVAELRQAMHRRAYDAHLEAARCHQHAAQGFDDLDAHTTAVEHLQAVESEVEHAAAELGTPE